MDALETSNEQVAMQGNIALIDLGSLFQFFDYATISGELRVVTDSNIASFFFQRGILIFGTLSVNQKRIGDMMVESGLVNQAQLEECLKIHSRQGQLRLGHIMVRRGFITLERLAETLKAQAREAFFATLSWKKGSFYFYANHHPAKDELLVNERIDHLLLEGIVRMENSGPR